MILRMDRGYTEFILFPFVKVRLIIHVVKHILRYKCYLCNGIKKHNISLCLAKYFIFSFFSLAANLSATFLGALYPEV